MRWPKASTSSSRISVTFQCICLASIGSHVHAVTSVVSDSLWPQGLYRIGLLCPRDSPGKNTGVGCHALLRGIFSWLTYLFLNLLVWPPWETFSWGPENTQTKSGFSSTNKSNNLRRKQKISKQKSKLLEERRGYGQRAALHKCPLSKKQYARVLR